MDSEPAPLDMDAADGKPPSLATDVKSVHCPRCNIDIPTYEKVEHDDWHMAMDLQNQDQSGAPAQANAPAQATAYQAAQQFAPPSFAPPSHAPPPKEAKISNAQRARHSNKVIEAANVRARDEVCLEVLGRTSAALNLSISKSFSLTLHSKKCKITFRCFNFNTRSTTPTSSPSTRQSITAHVQFTSIKG